MTISTSPAGSVKLRPYQIAAVEATIAAAKSGLLSLLIMLATGLGKTVVAAELGGRARSPVLFLAHREELVRQAAATMAALTGKKVAIEMAGETAGPDAEIVCASIQTFSRRRPMPTSHCPPRNAPEYRPRAH